MVSRRTFNRRSTALYSDRISSESSHVNVARSIQSRKSWALGFEDETMPQRKPEIPATRTEVSTTPLGRLERGVVNDCDLRKHFAHALILPHRLLQFLTGNFAHLSGSSIKGLAYLTLPSSTPSAPYKVRLFLSLWKLFLQFTRQAAYGNLNLDGLRTAKWARPQRHVSSLLRVPCPDAPRKRLREKREQLAGRAERLLQVEGNLASRSRRLSNQ